MQATVDYAKGAPVMDAGAMTPKQIAHSIVTAALAEAAANSEPLTPAPRCHRLKGAFDLPSYTFHPPTWATSSHSSVRPFAASELPLFTVANPTRAINFRGVQG